MFTWVKGNVYTLVLTLYSNDITLNSSAASYFKGMRWVMIGPDKNSLRLGVCPVIKWEIDPHPVSIDQLYKVSVGRGYIRISNKMIIKETSGTVNQPTNGLKTNMAYDEMENIPIVDPHELAADKG